MYVVVATDISGAMSVYGAFRSKQHAEAWAESQITQGIELTVLPVIDPREDRRRGQMSENMATDLIDSLARHYNGR